MKPCREIILASSSTTRQQLLDRLHIEYRAIAPDIDESARPHENAAQLALRLSQEKAYIIAQHYPDAIVIGSDQVAWLEGQATGFIGKPHTESNAIQQLHQQSGKVLHFSTAITVQCLAAEFLQSSVVPFQVQFRQLCSSEIQRYVTLEQPLHCAGSFKCEGLGMTLFSSMQGEDYTALMGLPLLRLCQYLRRLDIALP